MGTVVDDSPVTGASTSNSSATLEKRPTPQLVFSANPGRSGSGFLATLLGSSPGVSAGHERLPVMGGAWLRRVAYHGPTESYAARRMKIDALEAEFELLGPASVYVDTSHMFIKTWADVALDHFPPAIVSVVVLRRDPVDTARSFFELDELGPIRAPWHDFSPCPTAPAMRYRLDADDVQDQFDLIFGCLVDSVVRTNECRNKYPAVKWIDAALEQISSADGAMQLFGELRLAPPDAIERVVDQRVNLKQVEKQRQSQGVSRSLVETRMADFIQRFGEADEVQQFITHYGLNGVQ